MANKKISGLTAGTTVADNDLIPFVDVSDEGQAATGSTKKATRQNILGGKTLPTGAFVGDTDTQTLTNKTFSDSTFNNGTLGSPKITGRPKFTPRSTPTGMVTFQWDDGPIEDLNNMKPVFDAQGEVGTLALVASFVGTTDYLDADDVQEFIDDGWDIVNHSYNHTDMTTQTEEELREMIEDSQQIFNVDNDFNVESFAYPHNAQNALIRRLMQEYNFRSARGGWEELNDHVLNTYNLRSYNIIGGDYDLAGLQAIVDQAKAQGKWVIFYAHSSSLDSPAIDDLNDLIDYIQAANVPILTTSQALDQIENTIELGDIGALNGNKIRLVSDGWIPVGVSQQWLYASADDPTFTFTIYPAGDYTGMYSPGMKVKLIANATQKYFIITKVAYAAGTTTITVFGGTDYDLTDDTMFNIAYSTEKAPHGFPMSASKWSVSYVSTSDETAVTDPTAATAVDLTGSAPFSLPIGSWLLSWNAGLEFLTNTSNDEVQILAGLTFAGTADTTYFRSANGTILASAAANWGGFATFGSEGIKTVTAKTAVDIFGLTLEDLGAAGYIRLRGTRVPTSILAISAYL